MFNPLDFSSFNGLSNCKCIVGKNFGSIYPSSFLIDFLVFNKLPENPVVTPTTSRQVIYPSANNRYLASVTVEATSTTTGA